MVVRLSRKQKILGSIPRVAFFFFFLVHSKEDCEIKTRQKFIQKKKSTLKMQERLFLKLIKNRLNVIPSIS